MTKPAIDEFYSLGYETELAAFVRCVKEDPPCRRAPGASMAWRPWPLSKLPISQRQKDAGRPQRIMVRRRLIYV